MIAKAIAFPNRIPESYIRLVREPEFVPARHLALEKPDRIITLEEFGYDAETRARCPSQVAISSAFRILTDEGVAALREVGEQFRRQEQKTEGNPEAAYVKPRGSAYSSRFARDLSQSPDLLAFVSEIAGTPLGPHTMPTLGASFIYAPPQAEKTNQGWHMDSLGFDCVIMVSDPDDGNGGGFQYFQGTLEEVARICGVAEHEIRTSVGKLGSLPAERIHTMTYRKAGYGAFMQGNMVLHRGEPLKRPAVRSVFVPGFIALDLDHPDVTNWREVRNWNSPSVKAEYLRHKAWRAASFLEDLVETQPFDDLDGYRARLLQAQREIEEALAELGTRARAAAE
ncbi:MAG TPA: hypothetical protein VJL84_06130 [Kiloniellales bacterium]|nr:hypothetical protein [Kiloniellales bacterium]